MYRIWRHPSSEFGIFSHKPDDLQDETVTAEAAYSDNNLAEISASGFNAIWVHGQLQHMIHGDGFPEFGRNSKSHLEKMKILIARAEKHNLKVFLYMQPPRAISVENKEFWDNHLDVAGEVVQRLEDCSGKRVKMRCLCTSKQKVRQYIKNALCNLTEALPDLGGYIFISASEYPSHCYAQRNCRPGSIRPRKLKMNMHPVTCPNCAQFEPEDVVVELLWTIRDGIRMASRDMPIIFWNWSWNLYIDSPCKEIISRLPRDTCLLVGFERGGKKDLSGRHGQFINEYSLSYAGPSEQFIESMQLAREYGLEVMAKLQFGTTHELATVVSLPLLGNVLKKAVFIRENKLKGFMGCWNFGNQQSANTAGFNYFISNACPDSEEEALKTFAGLYFKECDKKEVVRAWLEFDKAMMYFPFCIPFLYMAPTNYALALIPQPGVLNKKSAGRSWLMDERGDDLSAAITDFSLSEIIKNFDSLYKIWCNGVNILRKALKHVGSINVDNELGNAEICGAVWRSTRNAFMLYGLRLAWQNAKLAEYCRIASNELENVKNILPYVSRDPRQGFHIEAHDYMFNAEMLKHKIKTLESQLDKL